PRRGDGRAGAGRSRRHLWRLAHGDRGGPCRARRDRGRKALRPRQPAWLAAEAASGKPAPGRSRDRGHPRAGLHERGRVQRRKDRQALRRVRGQGADGGVEARADPADLRRPWQRDPLPVADHHPGRGVHRGARQARGLDPRRPRGTKAANWLNGRPSGRPLAFAQGGRRAPRPRNKTRIGLPSLSASPMFIDLSATSNFTFLPGASHPEEMMAQAAAFGQEALAIADLNSVAGIVRAHVAARETRRKTGAAPRLIPAALIRLTDGFEATALPRDRAGWGRLCRLISAGRLRAPKGECHLGFDDLLAWSEGITLLLHPPGETVPDGWMARARQLACRAGADTALLMAPRYDGGDAARFDRLDALADRLGLPTVASGRPLLHSASRRRLADVLTAIRT